MAYTSTTYRILLASPGDVRSECDSIEKTIHLWNSSESERRGITFLPTRWEVDSTPELGDDPQAILNRQLVDRCDVLIGVFWTRLGTATPRAASGTVEEITRFVASKRHAMIYFSQKDIPRAQLNLKQIEALDGFREQLKSKGVFFEFDSTEGLAHQVMVHLGRAADRLVGGASGSPPSVGKQQSSSEIQPILDRVGAESSLLSGADSVSDSSSPGDEEFGILDNAELAADAMRDILTAASRVHEHTSVIGQQMQAHTNRINALVAEKGTNATASESKAIINDAALDLETFARNITQDTPIMGGHYARFAKAITTILTLLDDSPLSDERIQELVDLRTVTQSMPMTLDGARSQMGALRATIASLPRMTARLNQARSTTVTALTYLESEMESMIRLTGELDLAIMQTLKKQGR